MAVATRPKKTVKPIRKTASAAPKAAANASAKASTANTPVRASKAPTKAAAGKAPVKRVPPKKVAAKKAPAAPAKKTRDQSWREYDANGFMKGTDSAVIADLLIAGGADRADIAEKVAQAIETTTRTGTEKNIAAMVSSITSKMVARGYTVESSFRLVPPK